MFPNLRAEMVRRNISVKDMSSAINKSQSWLENRIGGKSSMPIDVAILIHRKYFDEFPLSYVFSLSPSQPHDHFQAS